MMVMVIVSSTLLSICSSFFLTFGLQIGCRRTDKGVERVWRERRKQKKHINIHRERETVKERERERKRTQVEEKNRLSVGRKAGKAANLWCRKQ